MLGAHASLLGVSLLALLAGLLGLCLGQPYHLWYPLVLIGGIGTLVLGLLLPVVRRRYREAEQRRLDAEALRRS